MEQAIKYTESLNAFLGIVKGEVIPGRRFDRVSIDKSVRFFIDKNTWQIYGAKSVFQYNPRRLYGELGTVEQWDWSDFTPVPKPGTPAEQAFTAREQEIAQNYKPRGRPRKNP